jgi:starch phosphorylase
MPLTKLITEHIGDGFLRDYREMDRVRSLLDNESFLHDYAEVKKQNKIRLRDHLFTKQGVEINTDTAFDVQAKRLHEYKRQLLKAMHILHLYYRIKENHTAPIQPATFLFAAKAAPGYYRAKEIIRFINAVGDLVNNDPQTKDILKVVFIENYGVSEAEILIPAADISEQLSTAGLEASGTGNMKFMLNGAVTIGTMDGANVEIFEAVGEENIFIFGAKVEDVDRMRKYGSYRPRDYYEQNHELKQLLDSFCNGILPVGPDRNFEDLFRILIEGNGARPDEYFVLYDFASYDATYSRMMNTYGDPERWFRIAAANTANAGTFFADRTVTEYNEKIWRLKAIE